MQDSLAYRALLDNTPGVALCDPERRVHFAPDDTGAWQTLTNADAPRLQLLGRLDLIEQARISDGPGYAWVEQKNTEHARTRRAA